MSDRHIFKIIVLSHDEPLYEELIDVFGVNFKESYTRTSGAAFSYSHFTVDSTRLTGQFWMLDSASQWKSIRNLYLKGASGIILLMDPAMKNAEAMNKRLLKEFVSINRFPVPIVLLNINEEQYEKSKRFAEDIARWTGYKVPCHNITDDLSDSLNGFMRKTKDWRAKNVIFQTLKLYFELDAINNVTRSIKKIITQLRKIYTAQYYSLISDKMIADIVREAALLEGFGISEDKTEILYEKSQEDDPWTLSRKLLSIHDMSKPTVEKLD